jgi:Rod binding domain-containing protein
MILSSFNSNPDFSNVATIPAATLLHSQNGKFAATDAALLSSPADPKLRKAVGEFESLLLSNLWKSMNSTFAADDDDDSTDPAHDTLQNWGIDAMSGAVGKAGGLGLGKLILKHLELLIARSQSTRTPDSSKVSSPSADTSP